MPHFKVAHLCEQGQNMIIFPLTSAFGHMPSDEQNAELSTLQYAANEAGLAGTAVAVWDAGAGRMGFLGPRPWHSFLQSINLHFVRANLNR